MHPPASRSSRSLWSVVVMFGGVLFAILPAVYAIQLSASLGSQYSEYRVPIRSAVVVQGMVTDRQVKSVGGQDVYLVAYLYEATWPDGKSVWLSKETSVRQETYSSLANGGPVTVVYSASDLAAAYIRSEILAPRLEVPLATMVTLGLLAGSGVLMVGWGVLRVTIKPAHVVQADATGPSLSRRPASQVWRVMLAGVLSVLVYGQVMVVTGLLSLGQSSGLAFILYCMSTPGRLVLASNRLAQNTPANILAASAVYWFLGGAGLAALIKPKWLVALVWLGFAVATVILGFVVAILAMAGSSP